MISSEAGLIVITATLFVVAVILLATGMWLPFFTLLLGVLGGSFGLLFYFGTFPRGK